MKQQILLSLIVLTLFSSPLSAQYMVGTQDITLTDPSRPGTFGDREIQFDVYYPSDQGGANAAISAGQFPFIVFGHGFGMATTEYSIWYETLAAQGYIIALPSTEGSVFPFPDHEAFALDLSFLIDSFLDLNNDNSSFFYQTINGKTAVMGHSMGGGCSWTSAAGNSNITTMVTLAAAETNNVSAIGNAANLTIPTLTIAGAADCVVMADGAPIDMYDNLPTSPYHAFVDIIGASHCQFGIATAGSICLLGELCSDFIPIADQHEQMLLSANNWLDYYLKDDCAAWSVFQNHLTTGNGTLHNYMEKGTAPNPTVATPTITQNGNVLTASAASSYQWYLDGNPISGATGQSYTATTNGSYTVEITAVNGCTAISAPFSVMVTDTDNLQATQQLSIYPNPVKDRLFIDTNIDNLNNFTVQILDTNGQLVLQQFLEHPSDNITVSHLPKGIYFIKIAYLDDVLVESFVKL